MTHSPAARPNRLRAAAGLRAMASGLPAIDMTLRGAIGERGGIRADKVLAALSGSRLAPVVLRLDSEGGDVDEALRIHAALRDRVGPVAVEVTGDCLSSALLVLCAGDYRTARPGARFLVHAPAYAPSATPERWTPAALKARLAMLEEVEQGMADTLAAAAGGSPSAWRRMMTANTWLSARGAVAHGLVDDVLGE